MRTRDGDCYASPWAPTSGSSSAGLTCRRIVQISTARSISPEQLLGTKRYTRDVELPKSSKSFYCRARALAMETLSAVERRCHYPRITRVPISDELVQYVGVRWEKASFLGRDCHDIVIEEMSELDYSYSQDDEGSDSLSKGTNIVPGKTPVEGGRSPTGSEDGSTTSSDTEDVQEQ
jgi:hypothetical protein